MGGVIDLVVVVYNINHLMGGGILPLGLAFRIIRMSSNSDH
jgi:hypothetical protein